MFGISIAGLNCRAGYATGRRENSRGPGQNFIRGPYDVSIFKQLD